MSIVIKPASDVHSAACAKILSDWIDETQWMPRLHTREEDLGFISHLIHTGQVMVALMPECTGFLAMHESDISCLYVAPEARDQGIGQSLLNKAKTLSPDYLTLWIFQANSDARRFYEVNDFSAVEQTDGDNDERLPDVRLEWRGHDG